MTAAATAVNNLIVEVQRYLNRLPGPGLEAVRAGLQAAQGSQVNAISGRAPSCGFLAEALNAARDADDLVRAIRSAGAHLDWSAYDIYPRADIGPRFPEAHAFAGLIGQGTPIHADDFELGFFLMAPHILYRDHHHAAPELYAPLTGPHRWRFGPEAPWVEKQAHEPVWNDPWAVHATITGAVPFLCIFAWTGDVNAPAKTVFAKDWDMIEAAL